MAIASANVRNYFKLDLLMARSHDVLRQLFKNRYTLFNSGQVWDDSPTCGRSYLTNVIMKNKQFSLTPVQKTSISNGDTNEWDVTTLTALLMNNDRPKNLKPIQIQQLDNEDRLLKQLKDIRNTLAHNPSKSINSGEFNQLWIDITAILVAFGVVESELDKIKDDSVFEVPTQTINETNTQVAKHLNSLGTQAHKDQNFTEAIVSFTKASVLSGISDHDRAVFYSNMSSSRLALYEQHPNSVSVCELKDPTDQRYRALLNAKQARTLWPTWWKGHLRVGKAYAALNDHEKAISSFERAFALAPANSEIQKALDDSRQILGWQNRKEHLDPRLLPRTMDEQLNELKDKLGTDSEKVRMAHDSLTEIDPAIANVVKGHKYEHGDIDIKQNYEQAAKYFAKAASQENAEGIYNLARLTDRGLGVEKDHNRALKLFEQAAAQSPQHPIYPSFPNFGVAESEHALGLRYAEGIAVQKNMAIAAYWYQRGVDHGSAESANNLGLMYLNGEGVDKNLDKAEQLLQLSARRGDPNAMLALAGLLLHKNEFQMAKIWYDRACESGNVAAQANRDTFERSLQKKQAFIDSCQPNSLQKMNAIKNVVSSLKISKTVHKVSNKRYIYQYDVLTEYAHRGSIAAARMCRALEHFMQALVILTQSEILTEKQEDSFVHELSECYRLEDIVVQIPHVEMVKKVSNIVGRVLSRCNVESQDFTSSLDEDVRICYAVLHMDSHQQVAQFLESCKQKYPKSICFYELSAAVNSWLKQYEDALYNANAGLELDPSSSELLYYRAVALRLLDKSMDEAIEAYQAFLTVASNDHRKVPESYYAMAICYFVLHQRHFPIDAVKKMYEQGEEAEKVQLPCFLPYDSNSKTLLKALFDARNLLNKTVAAPNLGRKSRLSDSHRIEIIKQHREWEANVSQTINNSNMYLVSSSHKPRMKQQTAKSLIGLKAISLKEMNSTKDHVYNGHVLSVTVIEEARSWSPSIHLVIEDENLDCERMFIYNFPEDQAQHLITKVFTIGSKMSIINPYLRLGASDMKSLIRVDEFSSIIMQSESERVLNMCRCCGEPNALHVCGRCKQAHYCTKECQTMDWQTYKHKFICERL